MNKILSMSEAAKLLGIKGKNATKRCRILLTKLEVNRNIQLVYKRTKTYSYTTEAALKNAVPELFEEDMFTQATIQGLKETIQLLTTKVNSLSVEVRELKAKKS